MHAHRRGRPPDLRLRWRVTADQPLLQLEAVHHRRRARRHDLDRSSRATFRTTTGSSRPFELRCPEGSIVNSLPPAPISAAHMHVGLNAVERGADDVAPRDRGVTRRRDAQPRVGNGRRLRDREPGVGVGAARRHHRRVHPVRRQLGRFGRGFASRRPRPLHHRHRHEFAAATSSTSKCSSRGSRCCSSSAARRRGADGAGQARAGGGNQFSFRTHGIDEMQGTLFGMRRWLPLQGMAGGRPGACAEFVVHRADGTCGDLRRQSIGRTGRAGRLVSDPTPMRRRVRRSPRSRARPRGRPTLPMGATTPMPRTRCTACASR